MNSFIQTYNNHTNSPISETDVNDMLSENCSATAKVAKLINTQLNSTMLNNSDLTAPARFLSVKDQRSIDILAIPESFKDSGGCSLKVICAISDKDNPQKYQYHVLSQFVLDVAERENVVAGLIMSFITGPVNEFYHSRFKIDLVKRFIGSINPALCK